MEMEKVTGLGYVRISVPCVEDAVRFYCLGLGLEPIQRGKDAAVIATPDRILLCLNGGGVNEGDFSGITHVCYNTFDVDAAFERALEFGAVPSRESDPKPYTYKNLRMAFVRAPSGEEIEFWGIMRQSGSFGEAMPGNSYVKHFVHVALTVPDMPESIRFYESLGAHLKVDWEWGCSMRLADMRELELFTGGQYSTDPKAYTSFGFLSGKDHAATEKSRIGPAGEVIEFTGYGAGMNIPERLPDLFAEAPEV